MGSKSSNAAAPDPRLVEAQVRSMGIQDSAIARMLDNSNELLPLQKEQMRFGLDTSRTAYDQSQQDRGWMLGRRGALSGMQDTMVGDARTFDTEAERERLAGLAMGDVNQGFASAASQMNRDIGRMGINASDPRYFSMRSRLAGDQALAGATAMNKTRQTAKAVGWSLTDRAANALAGYPAMAMGATGAGAGYGGSGLGLANSGLQGRNSGYAAAGGLAGEMGSNAAGMYGAMGNYATGMENASGSAAGALMGGASTLAAGWVAANRKPS